MSNIKVSIICLVYNHEPYLRKCLDGFVNQKCNFEYEVLIHDDASTDNSASIIREYEEKYPNIIKPIYQKENQYSKGIKISATYLYPSAKGEYLAWCEGDDYWTSENKLQKQVDFLDSHPEYVACVHKYGVINKAGEDIDKITFGYYENGGVYTLDDFQRYDLPSQLATLVCRREVMLDGFDAFKEVPLQGDIKIFLQLMLKGNIWRFDDKLSVYRLVREIGGGSWTSRTLKDNGRYRKAYNGLRELEKVTKEKCGVKLNLKKRKQQVAYSDICVDKRVIPMLKKAIYYVFKQRGMFFVLISMLFKKGAILKNKI